MSASCTRWPLGSYDRAIICRYGHVITVAAISHPEARAAFCSVCGEAAVDACPVCGTAVRGEYEGIGPGEPFVIPRYCPACGASYPWTEARIEAAQALVEMAARLSPREQEQLKRTIDDLVRETPRTQPAILEFKRLVLKAGQGMAEVFREVLVDVLSEAVKRALWG